MTFPTEFKSLMLVALVGGSKDALEAWVRSRYGDPRGLKRDQLLAIVADLDRFLAAEPGPSELIRCVEQLRDTFARFATTAPIRTPLPFRAPVPEEPTREYAMRGDAEHVRELDSLIARSELTAEALEAWVHRSYGDPRSLDDDQLAALFADLDRQIAHRPPTDLTRCVARLRDGLWRFAAGRTAPTPVPVEHLSTCDAKTDKHDIPVEYLSNGMA